MIPQKPTNQKKSVTSSLKFIWREKSSEKFSQKNHKQFIVK